MKRRKPFKRLMRRLREPFEWFGIWLALAIIPRLSIRSLLGLSTALADLGYVFDAKGKRVAAANLRVILGRNIPKDRAKKIIRASYRNMMRVLLTIFWTTKNPKERASRLAVLSPAARSFLTANRPCITLSAHFGNWEMLSQACEVNGFHIASVAKNVKGGGMTERLTKARSMGGQDILPQEGALKGLFRALRRGSYVGLLVDQHTEMRDGGIWLDWFGLKSCITQGPATLAKMVKVPMCIGWCFPRKDGSYRVELGDTFPVEGCEDIAGRTEAVIRSFEKKIRRWPHLWCLNYQRWRYLLPNEPQSLYPFYAKPAKAWQCPPDERTDK